MSLTRWLPRAGRAGARLDLDRLAVARGRPRERDGFYYSKAAALDAYEVLRQLIDATDELRRAVVVVMLPPELVTDETAGLPAYSALQLRVVDEVRDRRRANPSPRSSGSTSGWRRSDDRSDQRSSADRVAARRAIEALRAGVPSRDAVAVLGSGQTEIEDRFPALLTPRPAAAERNARRAAARAADSASARATCSSISPGLRWSAASRSAGW